MRSRASSDGLLIAILVLPLVLALLPLAKLLHCLAELLLVHRALRLVENLLPQRLRRAITLSGNRVALHVQREQAEQDVRDRNLPESDVLVVDPVLLPVLLHGPVTALELVRAVRHRGRRIASMLDVRRDHAVHTLVR